MINGIVASPFATNHAVTHAYYHIHRFLYDLVPGLLKFSWIQKANEDLGSLITSLFHIEKII